MDGQSLQTGDNAEDSHSRKITHESPSSGDAQQPQSQPQNGSQQEQQQQNSGENSPDASGSQVGRTRNTKNHRGFVAGRRGHPRFTKVTLQPPSLPTSPRLLHNATGAAAAAAAAGGTTPPVQIERDCEGAAAEGETPRPSPPPPPPPPPPLQTHSELSVNNALHPGSARPTSCRAAYKSSRSRRRQQQQSPRKSEQQIKMITGIGATFSLSAGGRAPVSIWDSLISGEGEDEQQPFFMMEGVSARASAASSDLLLGAVAVAVAVA